MNVPPIVNDKLTTQFKYWENGIRDGMSYKGGLYRSLQRFPNQERLKAYQFGCQLCEAGLRSVISVKNTGYILWVSLQSEANWQEQPATDCPLEFISPIDSGVGEV